MQLQTEMAGANTTQREGTMRGRREESRRAGRQAGRQGNSRAKTQVWNVPRGSGTAC